MQLTTEVNVPTITYIYDAGDLQFIDATGVSVNPAVEVITTPITGTSLVSVTFTETGSYFAFNGDIFTFQVDVVSKSVQNHLRDLEDEALGSWKWNKTDGTLVLLRQDGTSLATFAAVDTLTESSRERIS